MARGGSRPGAGRKPKIANELLDAGGAVSRAAKVVVNQRDDVPRTRRFETMLDVLIDLVNSTDDERVMLQAAQIGIPYTNAKMVDVAAGKKEQRQKAAEDVGAGSKFAGRKPHLAVSNS